MTLKHRISLFIITMGLSASIQMSPPTAPLCHWPAQKSAWKQGSDLNESANEKEGGGEKESVGESASRGSDIEAELVSEV